MTLDNNTKLITKTFVILWIVALAIFVGYRARDWFPRKTEIKIVFEGSRFSSLPSLAPLKDKTTYYFRDCDFTGRQFGEYLTNEDVDKAINKLEKEIRK